MELKPGLIGKATHVVEDADTAAKYGSGLAPVLSTPHLVALMENTAYALVAKYLETEQSTVGTRIEVRHLAPTPVGMVVHIQAELMTVEGRRLHFHIEAWDDVEKIGEGEHERFIIDWDRFMQRVEQKTQ